jgi:hypothetical protein
MKRSPLKRHARLAPGRGPRRVVRVKAVNRRRKEREWARTYGSAERVAFVQSLPCLVCVAVPSENAHVGNGGQGRKADADKVVPLCFTHHRGGNDSYHALGRARFEDHHRLDLLAWAARVDAWWTEMEGAA